MYIEYYHTSQNYSYDPLFKQADYSQSKQRTYKSNYKFYQTISKTLNMKGEEKAGACSLLRY